MNNPNRPFKSLVFAFLTLGLAALFSPTTIFADEPVLTYQVIKQESNEETDFFSNGKMIATRKFNEKGEVLGTTGTIPDGVYKSIKDGKTTAELTFKNGKKNGPARFFHKNGQMKEKVDYAEDKKEGVEKYYDSSGNLKKEIPFKLGKAVFTFKAVDSGKTFLFYQEGKQIGAKKWKYPEGISADALIPDGIYRSFYPSGKLGEELPLKNGTVDGMERTYWENGKVKGEVSYVEDKNKGLARSYSEEGKLQYESNMEDGQLNGLRTSYNPDGMVSGRTIYQNNVIVKTNDQILADEKKEKALEAFNAVVKKYAGKKKPHLTEDARKYTIQAQSASDDKRYTDAIDLYQKALELAPWYSSDHYNLAILLSENNNYEDAIAEMKKYLLLEPNAKDAREAKDDIYKWEGKVGK